VLVSIFTGRTEVRGGGVSRGQIKEASSGLMFLNVPYGHVFGLLPGYITYFGYIAQKNTQFQRDDLKLYFISFPCHTKWNDSFLP